MKERILSYLSIAMIDGSCGRNTRAIRTAIEEEKTLQQSRHQQASNRLRDESDRSQKDTKAVLFVCCSPAVVLLASSLGPLLRKIGKATNRRICSHYVIRRPWYIFYEGNMRVI